MSNFFLELIINYLREGKIKIEFKESSCVEVDIPYMVVYSTTTGEAYKFDITRGDKKIIKFVADTENLVGAIIN